MMFGLLLECSVHPPVYQSVRYIHPQPLRPHNFQSNLFSARPLDGLIERESDSLDLKGLVCGLFPQECTLEVVLASRQMK